MGLINSPFFSRRQHVAVGVKRDDACRFEKRQLDADIPRRVWVERPEVALHSRGPSIAVPCHGSTVRQLAKTLNRYVHVPNLAWLFAHENTESVCTFKSWVEERMNDVVSFEQFVRRVAQYV